MIFNMDGMSIFGIVLLGLYACEAAAFVGDVCAAP
jgi:hypothetical protein